jgi:hypothetical protein
LYGLVDRCILQRVAAGRWSVARFAAIDMYGMAGTRRRRHTVTAEFVVGTVGLTALAGVLVRHGGWLWACWSLGCAANYGALAVHPVALYPRGRLAAVLDGVDVSSEIRRYSVAQLLLFRPRARRAHRSRPSWSPPPQAARESALISDG